MTSKLGYRLSGPLSLTQTQDVATNILHVTTTQSHVTLLRPGWLSRKNIWLQLSASLMVQAFRLHLLVSLIWVQLSVPKTTSEITHRITFLNGLKVCLSYPRLLLLNPMLHMRFLHMSSPRNGNTFYELIHTLVISCPPLSLIFVNSFSLL